MAQSSPLKSAAVQIVRPPTVTQAAQDSPEKPKRDATQRLCRNVLIYGSCKFKDAGCIYHHPSPEEEVPEIATVPERRSASVAATAPEFVPGAAAAERAKTNFSVEHLSAPVFVPKTPVAESSTRPSSPATSTTSAGHNQNTWPSLGQSSEFFPAQVSHAADGLSALGLDDQSSQPSTQQGYIDQSHSHVGDDSMFMPQPQARRPLDYHLYTSPLPHVSNGPAAHSGLQSFFISDDMRRLLQARQEAIYGGTASTAGLPQELLVYHSLYPLGISQDPVSKVYGLPTHVYRALNSVDGKTYCLRRIEGFKLNQEAAFSTMETWRRIRHPNIVSVREAFTTKAFNDHSLIFCYDFHPDSHTLVDEHLNPEAVFAYNSRKRPLGMPVPERLLWSYVTQLANAIKAIHSSGLAARVVEASKILVTGKNRIRLNCCGILDVLAYDSTTPLVNYQQEDLLGFGRVIASLACAFFNPGPNFPAAMEHISRSYSPDLKNVILYLLSKPSAHKTIDEVIRMLGQRLLNEFDAIQNYADVLESELAAEVENGRLVRLMTKLGFINERPEFELDPRWSETGDRYILKLFRDYVFHSVDLAGKPVLDLSHVLTCLNKVDAALDERIMLVARDDQSCLVVSYREIKHCIEAAYSELRGAGGS